MARPEFPFPQIATGDFDIAVVGQLPAANLPLGNEFEPGPVKMVGFEAALRREGFWNQDLEHAPGDAYYALLFANPDAELDDRVLRIPSGVGRETKEHEPP